MDSSSFTTSLFHPHHEQPPSTPKGHFQGADDQLPARSESEAKYECSNFNPEVGGRCRQTVTSLRRYPLNENRSFKPLSLVGNVTSFF